MFLIVNYSIYLIEYERIRTYLSLIASNYPKIRELFLPGLKNVSSCTRVFTVFVESEFVQIHFFRWLCLYKQQHKDDFVFNMRTADAFPVVPSLPRKNSDAIFRRERSDDRKCVCCSQATSCQTFNRLQQRQRTHVAKFL